MSEDILRRAQVYLRSLEYLPDLSVLEIIELAQRLSHDFLHINARLLTPGK